MTQVDDYPIVIRRAKDGFVAEAVALGLTRTGADVNALDADIRIAVGEILAVCERHGARIGSSWERDAARSNSSVLSAQYHWCNGSSPCCRHCLVAGIADLSKTVIVPVGIRTIQPRRADRKAIEFRYN